MDQLRRSERLQQVLQNRLLSKDEPMGEAEESTSQRQSRRKDNKTAKARKSIKPKGVTKNRRKLLPSVFSTYRDPKLDFDPDARVESRSRLLPGALSRQLFQMPLTKIEMDRKKKRHAKAKPIDEDEDLYELLDNFHVGQPNISDDAKRSAKEADDLAGVFGKLELPNKKAEGRRRRRTRTRRRNPNKNNHKNTNKQFPFVRRFRLRY